MEQKTKMSLIPKGFLLGTNGGRKPRIKWLVFKVEVVMVL